jgi:hypothetical protein
MIAKRRPSPTPEAEIRSVQVGVMLEPAIAARLDALRRAKPEMPTRSTLCRLLIVEGLDRADKKAK